MPFSGAISDVLIDRGHIVDKVIILLNPSVKSNGTTRLRNVYRIQRPDSENPFLRLGHFTDPFARSTDNPRHSAEYSEARRVFCEDLLNDYELIERLRSEKYDVFLTPPYDFCGLGLFQLLEIPTANAYSATQYDEFALKYLGIPQPPSYVTHIFDQEVYPKQMSIRQKMNVLWTAFDQFWYEKGQSAEEWEFLKTRIPNLPSASQLYGRLSYIFRNTNEILSVPRPESPKTKYIGGIAMKRPKNPLSSELQKILDSAPSGAIVVSFGSLFQSKSISREKKIEIVRSFDAFPEYRFIWKFDADDEDSDLLANRTNVFPMFWLPQIELLNDGRVKGFITHGGMNSYTEASWAGKPIIAISIFADQYFNAGCAFQRGMGIYLDKTNITTESLVFALSSLLNNPSFGNRAAMIASALRDRPVTPDEELVRFVEYSALHPEMSELLQLEGARMSYFEYFSIDIFSLIIGIIFSIFCSIIFLLRFLLTNQKRKEKTA